MFAGVLGVDKMDSEESERFWKEVGKGRLPGRHQRGHTAAYQAAVDRSTAKLRARERANSLAPLTQGDSSLVNVRPGSVMSTTTVRSTAPNLVQPTRAPVHQPVGNTGPLNQVSSDDLGQLTRVLVHQPVGYPEPMNYGSSEHPRTEPPGVDGRSNARVRRGQQGWGVGPVTATAKDPMFTSHEDAVIVQLCAEAAEFATMARVWDRWVNALKPTAKRAHLRYITECEGWGGIWGSLPRLIQDLYITEREPWSVRPQAGEARIAIQYHNACFQSMLSDRNHVVAEMERQYPTLGETTIGRSRSMGPDPAGGSNDHLSDSHGGPRRRSANSADTHNNHNPGGSRGSNDHLSDSHGGPKRRWDNYPADTHPR